MSITDKKETLFELKSENSSQFSNKCKDIFGNLEKLERKHEEYEKSRPSDDDRGGIKTDPSDADTETITPAFKVPQSGSLGTRGGRPWRRNPDRREDRDGNPPPWRGDSERRSERRRDERGTDSIRRELQPRQFVSHRRGHPYHNYRGNRRQKTPDYKAHPEKWTKYSLEDVGNEDMSESSNTRAAFAFLEERRKLREGEMKAEAVNTEDTSCSKGIFMFKKPVKNESKKDTSKVSSKVSLQQTNSNDDEEDITLSYEKESVEVSGAADVEKVEVEKVTFKSHKKSKRSIRSRDTDDD
ncbi:U5 small nuclear ribonucleoprotein TSSC4-like [Saccostrea cucullata]|uniref:U5 small nuclear ribonucleoprotein TSSC4-like n=1 Tax=Saccostrea cuccullata TaxID=36930 RepID=UPI002ED5DDD9